MIYMDNAATTAIRREVVESMLPYLINDYGNPSGVYRLSERAKNAVEESRRVIADIINADSDEIFFTSGGTESDNWAIKAEGLERKKGNIIVSSIEHHAVTESALWMKKQGIDVTFAPVDEFGIIRLDYLEKIIRRDTFLISVMLANNEIGTIQPVDEVSRLAGKYGAKVHSDAVAAFGHIDVDVKKLGVNYLSVSGHKICGPKGTGFLYVKGGNPVPYMHGGAQERDRRAGTENVAGIVGLATAARIAYDTINERTKQEKRISEYMIKRILREIPYSRLNGDLKNRVPGNMNFSFQYANGGMLVVMLNKQGICASAGSACTSNSGKPSHVLLGIGLDDELAESSLRLTINHTITHREADYVVECIKKDVEKLRKLVL